MSCVGGVDWVFVGRMFVACFELDLLWLLNCVAVNLLCLCVLLFGVLDERWVC